MKSLVITAGIACSFLACNSSATTASDTDSSNTTTNNTSSSGDTTWISLFDGNSLKGWHTYGKTEAGSAWNIDSNAIHLNTSSKEGYQTQGGGDLVSNDEFENFDLKLEWKIAKNGNSGIIFYVREDSSKYKQTWNTGLEMQVLDNAGHPDAKIKKHRAGDLYDLISSSSETVRPYGVWNNAEIKSADGKLDLYLNGSNVVSTTLWDDNWKKLIAGSKFADMPDWGTFKKGHIALQDHGNDVWFRNIMIRKL